MASNLKLTDRLTLLESKLDLITKELEKVAASVTNSNSNSNASNSEAIQGNNNTNESNDEETSPSSANNSSKIDEERMKLKKEKEETLIKAYLEYLNNNPNQLTPYTLVICTLEFISEAKSRIMEIENIKTFTQDDLFKTLLFYLDAYTKQNTDPIALPEDPINLAKTYLDILNKSYALDSIKRGNIATKRSIVSAGVRFASIKLRLRKKPRGCIPNIK
jgi:hypothetical protein